VRILITGGAGFVGANLGVGLRAGLGAEVTAFDNLRRRGSEFNLQKLRSAGIRFIHGDVRQRDDLEAVPGSFDLLIEASAEPSVHAGQDGSPAYVIATNLQGTIHCLEFARKRAGALLFLSTSRVYSIPSLLEICLEETEGRFEITPEQRMPGISPQGIAEDFPINGARSFYGATKLASEILILEYVHSYGLRAIINRCGVIAGPGQFGKTDQGIFTLWIARHHFGIPLRYTGFGGSGKQVRDLLHPEDLRDLIFRQIECSGEWNGGIFNIGGGRGVSVSLREMTDLCREIAGRAVPVGSSPETDNYDVPLYISDCSKARRHFGWRPTRDVRRIISDTVNWIAANQQALAPLFKAESGNA